MVLQNKIKLFKYLWYDFFSNLISQYVFFFFCFFSIHVYWRWAKIGCMVSWDKPEVYQWKHLLLVPQSVLSVPSSWSFNILYWSFVIDNQINVQTTVRGADPLATWDVGAVHGAHIPSHWWTGFRLTDDNLSVIVLQSNCDYVTMSSFEIWYRHKEKISLRRDWFHFYAMNPFKTHLGSATICILIIVALLCYFELLSVSVGPAGC